MNIKRIAKIRGTQDGAIWNNYLFRFDTEGYCAVYDLNAIRHSEDECVKELAEFPLLYTNIYNNYANTDNPMKGVCLVYRIIRNGANFSSTLVRIILQCVMRVRPQDIFLSICPRFLMVK